MLIYNYSRTTFEFVGEPEEAKLDPVGQQPMIPAYATTIEPPIEGANKIAIFDEVNQSWVLQDDFRGTVYYSVDTGQHTITEIGDTVPADCTTDEPPDDPGYYNITAGAWVPKPIEEVRGMKVNEAYEDTATAVDENLNRYSFGETDTWSKMNDECIQFQDDGTVGPLMQMKIDADPVYDTAEKLATMTVVEYQNYLTVKFDLEAQRSQHKLNINSISDVYTLMVYDTSVSL